MSGCMYLSRAQITVQHTLKWFNTTRQIRQKWLALYTTVLVIRNAMNKTNYNATINLTKFEDGHAFQLKYQPVVMLP